MLLRDLVAHAVEKFESAEIHSANVDAELLAGHVLQLNRGEVQAAMLSGLELDESQTKLFTELAARRFAREPLQHPLHRHHSYQYGRNIRRRRCRELRLPDLLRGRCHEKDPTRIIGYSSYGLMQKIRSETIKYR